MDDFLYTCSVSYITDVLQTEAQLTRWENEQLTSSPRGNDVPGIRTIVVITCKTRVAWLAVPQMEVVLVHEKARWREILTRFRDIFRNKNEHTEFRKMLLQQDLWNQREMYLRMHTN